MKRADMENKRFRKDERINFLYEKMFAEMEKHRREIEEIRLWNRRNDNQKPEFTNPVIEDCQRRIDHIKKHQYSFIMRGLFKLKGPRLRRA